MSSALSATAYSSKESKEFQKHYRAVVFCIDNINAYEKAGYTAKYPKGAAAYKPTHLINTKVQTTITEINCTTGRTGKVTPVAIVKPVRCGDVKVTNASLHSQKTIAEKNVKVGDNVWIREI
jgi:DNA ligase (NAD+)